MRLLRFARNDKGMFFCSFQTASYPEVFVAASSNAFHPNTLAR
ncbi:unnamed protein product [marine sediment metagenome]|uniref:Uncharacterized protein n=1 Tax=marine sediment metagenome TaxID=412755 RepID=X1GXK3_9ZZZZ